MDGHHHHLIQQHTDVGDRFPQWSVQETKEFLMIRAELDQAFMETKRNKLLWEVISNKMREKGYHRSPEQCKCKWKNLVTRYKGCETVEPESIKHQFSFYNELQTIFTERMQRMLWQEAEGATSGSKKKAASPSSDEDDYNEDSEGGSRKKKRRKTTAGTGVVSTSNNNFNSLKEILEDFIRQQMQLEIQWKEAFDARESERLLREREWRQAMEALENERLLMEQRWREREEQRRIREEARAERRDELITALLHKLRRDDI